jgi:uncharacterized protein (TIGR01777 family)
MKIVMPGGSGQVGTVLARALAQEHEVVVLSRVPRGTEARRKRQIHLEQQRQHAGAQARRWRTVDWDARTLGPWASEVDGADVVVNLAGRSVNCRYTPANRTAMLASRVESTAAIGAAIARASRPPRTWLQASTATIYAHRYDAPNDEDTGILGGDEADAPDTWRFSLDVATEWERALAEAVVPHTRKIALRSAMTMSPDRGGIFDTLLGLVRRGLGGKSGSGRQYISWIHEEDFVSAVRWLVEHEELEGAVNLAAPSPRPNAEFMSALRRAWGARIGLPTTEWMLEIGALLMRTETELVLKSRRVVPGRLLSSGFRFRFPEWPAAAADLCARWRAAHAAAPAPRHVAAHGAAHAVAASRVHVAAAHTIRSGR